MNIRHVKALFLYKKTLLHSLRGGRLIAAKTGANAFQQRLCDYGGCVPTRNSGFSQKAQRLSQDQPSVAAVAQSLFDLLQRPRHIKGCGTHLV